ncbi:hypothetical protein FYJ85_21085 [Victivallaceae bacterium BBE-744-WT-12]|uniref:Uncharacterized protein n=1 Tax=Victivallis lenta TaxID=2606640 RepID=A0A844G831_9BACT|nr:hypothetical protein [Victivallis lenta]MST99526.1 hypothetical protein [Victivallis lenta]
MLVSKMVCRLAVAAWIAGPLLLHGESTRTIKEADITAASCSMAVRQIVGYSYKAPERHCGKWEEGLVGNRRQKPQPQKNEPEIRAVALGEENGYYVFFTLRSFLDPFYPSPIIQNMPTSVVNSTGKEEEVNYEKNTSAYNKEVINNSSNKIENHPYIRYSELQLVWYKDNGGGVQEIIQRWELVSAFDHAEPKDHTSWTGFKKKESYGSGVYERPHNNISVEKHFALQAVGGQDNRDKPSNTLKAYVKYYDDHDIALLYVKVPVDQTPIPTLGLKNPTIACDLALKRSERLFGFKFNLIGKETFQLIQDHRCPKQPIAGGSGFLMLAGLAMEPSTFTILLTVDKAIAIALGPVPNRTLAGVWDFYSTIDDKKMALIATEVGKQLLGTVVQQ